MSLLDAVLLGDLATVKSLVEAKADVSMRTKHNTTLLCAAALPPLDDDHRANRFRIFKFLYSIGCRDQSPDNLGRTPLKVAMQFTPYNQGDVAAWLLLKHPAPFDHYDEDVVRAVNRLMLRAESTKMILQRIVCRDLPEPISLIVSSYLRKT